MDASWEELTKEGRKGRRGELDVLTLSFFYPSRGESSSKIRTVVDFRSE